MEIQMTDKNGIRLLTENKMVKENIEIIPVFDELEIVQTPGSSTTAVMSQKASSNLFANSLKGNKSGVAVSMDDIAQSSIAVVNTRSKNLIPYPYSAHTQTVNGITFTDNGDGSVTVKGTASGGAGFNLYYNLIESLLPQGSTIVVSGGVGSLDTSDRVDIFVAKIKADGTRLNFLGSPLGTSTGRIEEGEKLVQINIWVRTGMTVDCTIYPQLEKGTVATPYTPYVADDTPITVKSCGKNLLDGSVYENEETINGVTIKYIPEEDAYLINGTATGTVRRLDTKLRIPLQDKVTFSVEYVSGSAEKGTGQYIPCFYVGYSNKLDEAKVNWDGINFYNANTTATSKEAKAILNSSWFYIVAGNVFNNYKCRIMVEKGSTATPYEPYIEGETIQTTLADGAQLDSIAPNMTITTDNNGVMLDVEYKRDTNIAFEKLEKRLIALETAIVNG